MSGLHSFTKRNIQLLDRDELLKLARIVENTSGDWTTSFDDVVVDAQAILDLHWAAEDAGGWDGFEAWSYADPTEAIRAYNKIVKRAQKRLKQYSGEPIL